MNRWHDVEGTGQHLCDLDPKVKLKGKKAGICDGVLSTAALISIEFLHPFIFLYVTLTLHEIHDSLMDVGLNNTSPYLIKDHCLVGAHKTRISFVGQ